MLRCLGHFWRTFLFSEKLQITCSNECMLRLAWDLVVLYVEKLYLTSSNSIVRIWHKILDRSISIFHSSIPFEVLITNGINHNVAFSCNSLRYQYTRSTDVGRLLVSNQNVYFFKTRWVIQRRSCGDEEVSVSARKNFFVELVVE